MNSIDRLSKDEQERWHEAYRRYGHLIKKEGKPEKALAQAVALGRLGQPRQTRKNAFGLDEKSPEFAHAFWAFNQVLEDAHHRLCWRVLVTPPEKAADEMKR